MIRFPTMHIATSVVNRILNAQKDLETSSAQAPATLSVPNAAPLGEALDAAIAAPTPAVAELDPAMASDLTTQTLFQ